ncbi:unnamed protein product [Sphagnum balticum]
MSRLLIAAASNYHIFVYSIGEDGTLKEMMVKNMRAIIEGVAGTVCSFSEACYCVNVGLSTGMLMRIWLGEKGELKEVQEEKVGDKPLRLSKIRLIDQACLMRIGALVTISYLWEGRELECSLPLPAT